MAPNNSVTIIQLTEIPIPKRAVSSEIDDTKNRKKIVDINEL
jgi:hypothetical protein